MFRGSFLCYLDSFVVSKVEIDWFGEAWTRPLGLKIMNMMGFRVFPKRNRKVTSPKLSGVILCSFRATFRSPQ